MNPIFFLYDMIIYDDIYICHTYLNSLIRLRTKYFFNAARRTEIFKNVALGALEVGQP